MSISAITASTATSTIQSATSRQHRTNPVQQLFNAIKSGDLTAAQAAYQQVLANAPSSSGTSSTTASSGSSTSSSAANPLQQLLDQLGTALQSGDISSAQTALSSFLASAPSGAGGNGGPTGDQSTTGKAISSLFSAIQSGDLTTAQSDYATVSALLSGSGDTSGSAGTSATTGTGQDSFQQLISQIGTALQSGDISSAQSALSQFQSDAPPPPPSSGNGPDSSAGKALSSLFSSIQSGDLTSAQSAYASLESLLGSGSTSSSSSTTSSSTGASSSSSSSSGGSQDLFQQLLDNIGTDLSNNDLTSAQSALSNFSKGAPSGLAYNFYT